MNPTNQKIRQGSGSNKSVGGQSVVLVVGFNNWLDYGIFQNACEWHSLSTFECHKTKNKQTKPKLWNAYSVFVDGAWGMLWKNAYLVGKWKQTKRCIYKMCYGCYITEILAGDGKGHFKFALTLYLCDLICFKLFKSNRIPWQMGFGSSVEGRWGRVSPPWQGPYFKIH